MIGFPKFVLSMLKLCNINCLIVFCDLSFYIESFVFRSRLVRKFFECQMMKLSVGHVFWIAKLKYVLIYSNFL